MYWWAKYTKISYLLCGLLFACDSPPPAGTSLDQKPVEEVATIPDKSVESPESKPRSLVPYRTGAEILLSERLSQLQGLSVAVIANHTSTVFGGKHLVDTLLGAGIRVIQVFAPEHGFRGAADAGEKVANSTDPQTGLPILSLYGKNRKPTPEQLARVDLVIFDIQDVGSRHYTYISTMALAMEACAEANKSFMVLDRANPNGWYVDGPVMQSCCKSFIGMHQVPIVHGMTIGEYARMLNEEGWLSGAEKTQLTVIPCQGYAHSSRWNALKSPWNPPSPNLGTEYAAYLYPALCWFEPTPMSIGRGTEDAFTILGAPWFDNAAATARMGKTDGLQMKPYTFTPRSLPGKAKYPKFENKACQGYQFEGRVDGSQLIQQGLTLLAESYRQYQSTGAKEPFFQKGFERWPGNTELQAQLEAGEDPMKIWSGWQADIRAFKVIRQKYLLYQDFE